MIAAGNQTIDAIEPSADISYLKQVVQAQTVAQGIVSTRLAELGGGFTSLQSVINENTGSALNTLIAAAQIGNIIPPELSVSSMALVEGEVGDEFWLEFTVSLSAPSAVPVSIEYFTADYTATEGHDYEAASGMLTWAAGDVTDRTIRVKSLGDAHFEGNETFLVHLSNPKAASLFNNVGVGILVDDEPIAITIPAGNTVNELTLQRIGDDVELINNGVSIWRQKYAFVMPLEIIGGPAAENHLTIDLSDGSPIPSGGLTFISGDGQDSLQVTGGVNTELHNSSSGIDAGFITIDEAIVHYQGVEDVIRAPIVIPHTVHVDEGGTTSLAVDVSIYGGQDPAKLTFLWDLDDDGVFGELAENAVRGDELSAAPVFSAIGLDGPATFNVSVQIIDGYGLSANATFGININNVAPTANADSATTDEGSNITTNVTINDMDASSSDLLTVIAAGISSGSGTVSFSGGNVDYYPGTAYRYLAAGETATAVIEYTISDGDGGMADAILTITIVGSNDGPTARNDSAATSGDDASMTINVLANDTDPDSNDVLLVTDGFTQPQHGRVVLNADGTFTYTPGAGYECVSDSFIYTISDGRGGTSVATVLISVGEHSGVSTAGGILRVGGTSGADVITVNGSKLVVNGVAHSLTSVTELRIWGREGNDVINLAGLVIPTYVHGGLGDDRIVGGSADDVIFGGDGDDTITGEAGHDFLIGGLGKDRIVGSAGHDILVSAEVAKWLSLGELREISRTWKDSRTTTQQAADEFIDESYSDTDSDMLTGSSGADLFIISKDDKITDFKLDKSKKNNDGDVLIVDGESQP